MQMIRQRHRDFRSVIPSPKRNFGKGANEGWNVQGRMLVKAETAGCPMRKIRLRKPLAQPIAEKEIGQMSRELKLQLQLVVCGTCAIIIGIVAGASVLMDRGRYAINSDLERLTQDLGSMQESLNELDNSGMAEDVERIVRDLEGMSENLEKLDEIEKANAYSKESHQLIWKAIMMDAEGKMGPAEEAELREEWRELERRYESRNAIVRCPRGGECK